MDGQDLKADTVHPNSVAATPRAFLLGAVLMVVALPLSSITPNINNLNKHIYTNKSF